MKKLFNRFKKQIALGAIVLAAAASPGFAQVKGISYTLSPTGEYVFWNKNTGISDGFLVGGHLGFGFGEFVELRGTYLQDVGNLKRDFSGLSEMGLRNARLDSFDIGVVRWGGDLKLNLSRGGLVPFITIGTGVQTLSPDTLTKYKNIYVSAGAGFQLSGNDRYTFNVQAVNTAFNSSPVRSLTTAAERTANGLALADYPNDMLRNWSVRASLNLYLGGRRPGELSEVDRAVLNNYSSGISLPIEVTAGQLDFGKGLPYADTKFAGVATGFNFGPYVGLRAFYWRGLEDDFTSKFTKLALYGGEGKFKLGNGQGLTPALLVGGGVIDAMDGYQTDSTAAPLKKKGFASGGVGLDFPLGRALKLTAYGKALITSNDSTIENTISPDQLTTSFAYGLSLNLLIGNGAKDVETRKEKSYDELVMNTMRRERNRAEDLKDDLDKRIDRLDDQIKDARKNGDRRIAYDLEDEQDKLRRQVKKVDELLEREEDANKEASKQNDGLLMKMKPTEFGNELDDIEDEAGNGRRAYSSGSNDRTNNNDRTNRNDRNQQSDSDDEGIRVLEDRLKSIEQKLDDIQRNNQQMRQNRMDNGNYDNNRNYPSGDYRNGNNQNYNDRNYDNRNNNNSRNGNYDDRNSNGRNNDYRNGNYDDRNIRYDDRNGNNRNNNSRNNNYDDRNNDYRNNNRGNNDDDYRSNQNSSSQNNGDNNARRNFGSNGGSSRNANARPDTNDKFSQLDVERENSENLRKAYEDRIDALDREIDDAKEKGDDRLESQKQDEKNAMEDAVKQIRDAQDKENRANRKAIRNNDPDGIRMSSEDFRSSLDEVQEKNKQYQQDIERSMDKFRKDTRNEMRDMRDDKDAYQQDLEDEMRDLKAQIRDLRAGRGDVKKNDGRDNDYDRMNSNDRNDRNARRDSNDDNMNENSDVFANSSLNRNSATKASNYLTEEQQAYEPAMKAQDGFFSVLNYDGASAIAGFNLGGATTLNIGVRNHYRYKNTNFSLMPEAFFGFGSGSSFGLFANGIYDVKLKNREDFTPYAGLGLGLMKIGNSDSNNTKVAFNIVLGANLFKIANGRFYVDVSARNFFKYTQLAAGYRLPF